MPKSKLLEEIKKLGPDFEKALRASGANIGSAPKEKPKGK